MCNRAHVVCNGLQAGGRQHVRCCGGLGRSRTTHSVRPLPAQCCTRQDAASMEDVAHNARPWHAVNTRPRCTFCKPGKVKPRRTVLKGRKQQHPKSSWEAETAACGQSFRVEEDSRRTCNEASSIGGRASVTHSDCHCRRRKRHGMQHRREVCRQSPAACRQTDGRAARLCQPDGHSGAERAGATDHKAAFETTLACCNWRPPASRGTDRFGALASTAQSLLSVLNNRKSHCYCQY